MHIAVLTVTLHIPFAHSLKEKRGVVKPLVAKLRASFNASVVESRHQNTHQTVELTVAALAFDRAQADSIMDNVLHFIERNTEANITLVDRDMR